MKQLNTPRDVDAAIAGETAILYKHSTSCPISAAAYREVQGFLERNPDAPLFLVDVNAAVEASTHLERTTGIQHHSPQLILFRNGAPAWDASHFEITADALEAELRSSAA